MNVNEQMSLSIQRCGEGASIVCFVALLNDYSSAVMAICAILGLIVSAIGTWYGMKNKKNPVERRRRDNE